MYRINSVSKQMVRLLVVEGGKEHLVNLMPKNFVFTEKVTDQMKILENDGVIKVRQASVKNPVLKAKATPKPAVSVNKPMEGKLDVIKPADKVEPKTAKVKKKR